MGDDKDMTPEKIKEYQEDFWELVRDRNMTVGITHDQKLQCTQIDLLYQILSELIEIKRLSLRKA